MAYIANTPEDVQEMLGAIGVESIDDLFSDIPESVRLDRPVGPAEPLSEFETLQLMERRAAANRPAAGAWQSWLGAGSYDHFIPSAVQAIAQRGELLTAYTPYQPEASQGTLQIIFEFQSMICSLTGMEVANASMYDGASALAEAALMAVRTNGRGQIVVPGTLHPNYREVVESYTRGAGIEIIEWPADAAAGGGLLNVNDFPAVATDPAAVIIQQPNFFGCLEDGAALAAAAHERGALAIACVNPMSLSMVAPPGEWGADIVVGEAQPIGLPMHFGGPYAGFFATRKEHIRRMPGRIVGRTTDGEGRGGFVLTLQTREQHIRRDKATSNICTNQGLCATMVTLWLALIGEQGFERLGDLNLARAAQLREGLLALPGVQALNDAPYFNEFTLRLPVDAETFITAMRGRGILPGLAVTRLLPQADPALLLVCATETKVEADVQQFIDQAKAALEQLA